MEIKNKYLPEWVRKEIKPVKVKDFQIARISGVYKNSYSVFNDSAEILAELTGNLMFNIDSPLDYPTVGDWVYAQFFNKNSLAIIHEIIPRKTMLKRKMAGKKVSYQLIAANVDIALIIQSLDNNFNLRRMERYISIAKEDNIKPIILLSKSDLLSKQDIKSKISAILSIMPNIKVIAFSNMDNKSVAQVTQLLETGKTYCLIGSSGVGKTTLINHILERDKFKTREVRKDGKGKHTTTNRQLINLTNQATIIDTPGMRELGITDSQKGIGETFQEITELAKKCRFNNCTHTVEEGCAVLAALNEDILSNKRYENYIKMKKESAHYEMSYADRRKKEKLEVILLRNIIAKV